VTVDLADRFAPARSVADAVLYEGYVLYPYRASSAKNQIRWQFGVLTPPAYCELDPSERSSARTECLIDPGDEAQLRVRIRFLHVQHRGVDAAFDSTGGNERHLMFSAVDTLQVDGETYVDWEEAVDQVVDLPLLGLSDKDTMVGGHVLQEERMSLAGWLDEEIIRSVDGAVAGRVVRTRLPVDGRVIVKVSPAAGAGPYLRVSVTVENTTEITVGPATRREEVMSRSLVAVHTMLAVDGGSFVSLLDPPAEAAEAVADCKNVGTFPVLIARRDLVLSSPIILYDYPQVAPESPGDLYDSTEIDEILALRVLTLTDEEKAEARGTDPRAAAIIDRCDDMAPEMWDRLHGTMRSLRSSGDEADEWLSADPVMTVDPALAEVPWWDPAADASVDPWSDSLQIAGVEIKKGASVYLRPSHRSDAQDIFLDGLVATVAGVFKDVDGNDQIAVTVDDDPATEELIWQGRYLFFHPDEVEPLGQGGEM
jgi:hypothetical protein